MLLSMNWISDFVDLSGLDLKELIDRFTLSAAEVEEVTQRGRDLSGVIVGRILEVADHPNSKKLHLLIVDTGSDRVDCVCGAPNVRTGMTVAFAKVGAHVAGMEITEAKIAGAVSFGMCCSEKELGISDDHSGLMELPSDALLGADIKSLYGIEDTIFEVDNKSLTNRPDLWGHYGIAREFAALAGRPLRQPALYDPAADEDKPALSIRVSDSERCLRYSSLRIENIGVSRSPVDMRIRLYYCGMRAISLTADLTNYVMLEQGQPMHAFDLRRAGDIDVKTYAEEFDFTTLDGVTRRIDPETLMITSGGKPVAVGGIMGGIDSEILPDTTSILLESANFDGVSIRKSETRLGLRTEASIRYEKVLDPELTLTGIRRFTKLLFDVDPGARVTSRLTDVYARRYPEIRLMITRDYIDRYTGINIPDERILSILRSLGFGAARQDDVFHVQVPSWRATKDVTIKADLIEEITRVYGYDNFEYKSTLSPLAPVRQDYSHELEYAVKQLLCNSYGLHEIHSYIWYDEDRNRELGLDPVSHVSIANSVNPETTRLRSCMTPSLLYAVQDNSRAYDDFGIFEAGRAVVSMRENACVEHKLLGICRYALGRTQGQTAAEVKAMLDEIASSLYNRSFKYAAPSSFETWQHPVNTAAVLLNGRQMGIISVLHPSVCEKIDRRAAVVTAELDLTLLAEESPAPLSYRNISRYPGIDMDLSLLAPKDMRYGDIASRIASFDCPYLEETRFVGVYEDASIGDKKSVTVRCLFQAADRTLSGEEAAGFRSELLAHLAGIGVTLMGTQA